MSDLPRKLESKLRKRRENNAFRSLSLPEDLIDFSSNDYLGFARNPQIYEAAGRLLSERRLVQNGSTGSRLLTGNNKLYMELEGMLARFHHVETALVFNSGYDANVGFFACVPQRGDIIFYDELIHASIRDGIELGLAKSYKFRHNDLGDLKSGIERSRNARFPDGEIFVVTESVFSMDGDSPDLPSLTDLCSRNRWRLVVDEAHAIGIFGLKGSGLVQELGLGDRIFARIVTFGKAIGCHGAVILGSGMLKNYLVNFARSLIYTTGLPPHSLATILSAYKFLSDSESIIAQQEEYSAQSRLLGNISFFNQKLETLNLKQFFIPSRSAIHCCIVPGNEEVKLLAQTLREKNFDVRPILSPTVPKGKERLRICIHGYNTEEEMADLLKTIKENVKLLKVSKGKQ